MAYRARRRGRRSYPGLGGYLRSLPAGFVQLLLASAIMALGAAIGSALSGNLVLNFSIGQNTVSLDLGFVPGIAVVFGGLFMFLSGLRKVIRTRL